ncbi:hypothetical protein ACFY41_21540 [Streptomyces syringium]|uniref:hypothetical protein n=1 Tax=Streptomyces syringium TaxID=76729 RepID=UPI0036B4E51B
MPRNLHVERPDPHIGFESLGLRVPCDAAFLPHTGWPAVEKAPAGAKAPNWTQPPAAAGTPAAGSGHGH